MSLDALATDFVGETVIADEVSTTTTGVKLSYTVPANTWARLVGVSWFNTAGTPTVQLQLVRAGATLVLRQDATSYRDAVGVSLEAADVIQFNVTVAGTTSTADAVISVEENRL